MNVIENALKYTPKGTPLDVVARAEADANANNVTLEVRDRGPGIAAGEESRIFEKFYRVGGVHHKGTAGVRGAGLGLAICRAIMQAHQGSMEAFNREGGGAVFRMRLPIK
jgi:two-component system sensor histidine kinase KdpD